MSAMDRAQCQYSPLNAFYSQLSLRDEPSRWGNTPPSPRSTTYTRVHPKKKIRMTYDLELASHDHVPPPNNHHELAPPCHPHVTPLTDIGGELHQREISNPSSPGVHFTEVPQDHSFGPVAPPADVPQDLRVSYNERLKDVARDILLAVSIPQLNSSEIPHIVSSSPPPHDKKMSGSSTHSSFSHLDMTPSTLNPSCEGNGDGSCPSRCYTTSCRSSFNSSNSNSPRNGILPHQEPEWVEKEPRSAPTHLHHSYEDKHTTDLEPQQPIQDPEAYLRKPIEEWGYADVIFFLMEACKELRINPGDVKFKRSDDGTALLRMSPSDFEVLAPSRGQVLYDYFINFKTQHYMASEERNLHPSYTYENNCSDVHHSAYLQNDGSQSMHHQDHHIMERSYSHNHIESPCESSQDLSVPYSQYPNSPYSCSTSSYKNSSNSPTNEYVPQGSQYLPQTPSSEPSHRKSYDLPSAAWKTFPPLHNYDEPLSDPDEFEDEPPAEPPKKRGPGRPPKPESERKRRPKKTGRLWEFIRNLLLDPKTCPSLLRWEDAHAGIFRIVQSDAIANKWGMRKNNENMNYEKLSRAMRYYYKAKIFEPVLGKRLVYKFGSNAKGWRPLNPNNPNFQNY